MQKIKPKIGEIWRHSYRGVIADYRIIRFDRWGHYNYNRVIGASLTSPRVQLPLSIDDPYFADYWSKVS